LEAGAYAMGAFSPIQNRIYLIPSYRQNETWHYIDCNTGLVVPYDSGGPTLNATAALAPYHGAAYSPTQNRIYFAPLNQVGILHYIDCDTGTVVPYNATVTTAPGAYAGASYFPNLNRIYFVPDYFHGPSAVWHYIDDFTSVPISRSLMAGAMFNKY